MLALEMRALGAGWAAPSWDIVCVCIHVCVSQVVEAAGGTFLPLPPKPKRGGGGAGGGGAGGGPIVLSTAKGGRPHPLYIPQYVGHGAIDGERWSDVVRDMRGGVCAACVQACVRVWAWCTSPARLIETGKAGSAKGGKRWRTRAFERLVAGRAALADESFRETSGGQGSAGGRELSRD